VSPYSTRTDAELLRAADRDADAFAALYDRYARRAVSWARRGGVPDADVVDLVAELFAQAWRSRRRFRDPGDGDAGGWLHGIARNLIARYHRRGRNETAARRRLGLDRDTGTAELERAAARLDAARGAPAVEAALAALPAGQARAVRLRVVEGLEYAEIAARLSCTPVTARKQVSLGLNALRTTLDLEAT
jgi:RNA polymerase sigma-70 factor (ECF subfamily)